MVWKKARKVTMKRSNLFLLVVGLIPFYACSVGPNYVRPPADVPASYKEMDGWKVAQPQEAGIGENWWELYGNPELSALLEQVQISNQNVATAEAQFRQALALVQAARAGYFPTLSASPSYSYARTSGSLGPLQPATVSSTYTLPLTMSWELDIWGKIRRQVESTTASSQASEAQLAAVRLSAQSQLAQNYFQIRFLDGQKKLLDTTIAAYQRTLDLTKNRYAGGVASKGDVLQAETQLKTVQAQAIDIGVQRAQLEHASALLCGKPASSFSIPEQTINIAPPAIPVRIPSELLERRPDIASSERQMAAANAQIGVAEAAYYPSITLSAAAGLESLSLANWLSWPSRFWAVGPTISELLFDGGLRNAQTDQARAAYSAAIASYRQTVLTGFQEVEDSMSTLRILEKEAHAQDEAVSAASKSLSVIMNQYESGIIGYLNVITGQTTLLNNQVIAIQINSRRMVASVQLIIALGGGWKGPLSTAAK